MQVIANQSDCFMNWYPRVNFQYFLYDSDVRFDIHVLMDIQIGHGLHAPDIVNTVVINTKNREINIRGNYKNGIAVIIGVPIIILSQRKKKSKI